jgi:hypothetical protein
MSMRRHRENSRPCRDKFRQRLALRYIDQIQRPTVSPQHFAS